MNNLTPIINRLASDPNLLGKLIKERGIYGDKLHAGLDKQQQIEIKIAGEVANLKGANGQPLFSNRELRDAQVQRLLDSNLEYNQLLIDIELTRQKIREIDAEIEIVGRRNNGDQKIVSLITSMISTGMVSEVQTIINAYTNNNMEHTANIKNGNGNYDETSSTHFENKEIFFVTEARQASSPDTIRAYCKGSDGKMVAIFAKNGNGKLLLNSVNKHIKVSTVKVDRGLFANKIEVV